LALFLQWNCSKHSIVTMPRDSQCDYNKELLTHAGDVLGGTVLLYVILQRTETRLGLRVAHINITRHADRSDIRKS
jgi:hypothetical protein